jgi:hypothetical protein
MRTIHVSLIGTLLSIGTLGLIGCGSGAEVAVTVTGGRGLEAGVEPMSSGEQKETLLLHVVRTEAHLAGAGDDGEEERGKVDDQGWVVLSSEAHDVDLLSFDSAEEIAEASIAEGRITQLRLILDAEENATFVAGDTRTTIDVPSGAQTGLKLVLAPPVAVSAEERAIFKVELDGAVELNAARGTLRPTAKVSVTVEAAPEEDQESRPN